jgi:hypothetical protein
MKRRQVANFCGTNAFLHGCVVLGRVVVSDLAGLLHILMIALNIKFERIVLDF